MESGFLAFLNLGLQIKQAADKASNNKVELLALAERSRKLLIVCEEQYACIVDSTDASTMSSMLEELEIALRRILSICDKKQPRSKLLSMWKRDDISFAIQLAEKDLERAFRQFNVSMVSQIRTRQEQEALKLGEVLHTMRTMASHATSNILGIPPNDATAFNHLLFLDSNTSQESLIAVRDNIQEALDITSHNPAPISKEQEFLKAAISRLSEMLPVAPSPVPRIITHPGATSDGDTLPPWFDRIPMLGAGTEASDMWMRISEIAALMSTLEDIQHEITFPDLALKAMDLSLALADLGFREDASQLGLKATEVYRHLADVEPETYSVYLAASLAIVSDCMYLRGHQGDMHAAEEYAAEAIEIYRRMDSSPVRIQLARCLTAHARNLNELGLHSRALDSVEEAVSLLQESCSILPESERENVLALLAMAMGVKHRCFAFLRRVPTSLVVIEEVLSMQRALVALNPDAYRPELAAGLNNYAIELNFIGRAEEALVASTESVDIRRELATTRPGMFQPYLARSMCTLSSALGNLGRSEESLKVIKEVVRIRREEVDQFPGGRFRSSLARALRTLAWRLNELGDFDGALSAVRESINLFRPLVAERPQFYFLPMAVSLYTAGKAQLCLDHPAEALEYLKQSLDIFRDHQKSIQNGLAEVEGEELWQEGLAACLQLLGEAYSRCGLIRDAEVIKEEAALVRSDLFALLPRLATRELGKML